MCTSCLFPFEIKEEKKTLGNIKLGPQGRTDSEISAPKISSGEGAKNQRKSKKNSLRQHTLEIVLQILSIQIGYDKLQSLLMNWFQSSWRRSKELLEMNTITLSLADVPFYHFPLNRVSLGANQNICRLAQSLADVEKKLVKKGIWEWQEQTSCDIRTVDIFLHTWKKITSVLLWQDRCVVTVCCTLNDDNAHYQCV